MVWQRHARLLIATCLLAASTQVACDLLGLHTPPDRYFAPAPGAPPRESLTETIGTIAIYKSKEGDSLPVWLIVLMCAIALGVQSIFLTTVLVLRKKKKKAKAAAEARRAAALAAAAEAAAAEEGKGGVGVSTDGEEDSALKMDGAKGELAGEAGLADKTPEAAAGDASFDDSCRSQRQ